LDELRQPDPPTRSDLATRTRLGRFHLREKLGEGGMGAVYRAEDGATGAVVAVKVLHPERSFQPEGLSRFQKEARLLAEVQSPHVVRPLEIGEEDGFHYLVLEYVDGPSLGRLLAERGRLDEADALAVTLDVARGLAAAH